MFKFDWQPIETVPRGSRDIVIWLGGDEQRWVRVSCCYDSVAYGKVWEFDDGCTVCCDDDVKWWALAPCNKPGE
jgi:hypothetical protein